MRRIPVGVMAAIVLLVAALAGQKGESKKAAAATVTRGKYLVEDVGLCADCHTPRDQKGEFVRAQWLQGAMVPMKPIAPMAVWTDKAPSIAGLPGWQNDAAIKFLMTGIAYSGLPPRPPMPEFRFNQRDAEAVVAYLKSLGTAN
jgi:mono/diheme cytochrome c family protein